MISVRFWHRADSQIRFGCQLTFELIPLARLEVLRQPLVGGMVRIQKHIALLYKL